jgi:hypothetical protein
MRKLALVILLTITSTFALGASARQVKPARLAMKYKVEFISLGSAIDTHTLKETLRVIGMATDVDAIKMFRQKRTGREGERSICVKFKRSGLYRVSTEPIVYKFLETVKNSRLTRIQTVKGPCKL